MPVGSPCAAVSRLSVALPSWGRPPRLSGADKQEEVCSVRITLTVFFESPFYVGLFERQEGTRLSAARVVFGAEPTGPELLSWLQEHYASLTFSPCVEGAKAEPAAANPKRRLREAARSRTAGVGTRAQQALQLAREAHQLLRQQHAREQRAQEQERQFQLRQERKKARHRGH